MIRKILIGLIGIIFVPIAVLTVFSLGFYNTLSSEDFYKETLVEEGYEATTTYIQGLIKEEIDQIPEEEILEIITKNIEKKDLSVFLEGLYKDISNLEIKNKELKIEISLDILIDKKDSIFESLVNYTWENFPKCESKDQENCIPQNISEKDFKARAIADLNNKTLGELPTSLTFDIVIETKHEGKITEYLSEMKKIAISTSRAILLLLLVIVALIVLHPWKKILKTELKLISSTCFILIVTSTALLFLPNYVLENLQIGSEQLLLNFLYITIKATAKSILLYSGVIFVLSTGGILLLKYYKNDLTERINKKD